MRKEFVETQSRKKALEKCPWAFAIVKVVGGYKCYESANDYRLIYGEKIYKRHLVNKN